MIRRLKLLQAVSIFLEIILLSSLSRLKIQKLLQMKLKNKRSLHSFLEG
jgi:hypothetical protein